MKANELRIGNLVFDWAKRIATVESITSQEVVRLSSSDYKFESFNLKEHGVSPIPLTEYWHNNFGLTKDGFNQFEYKYAVGKSIIFTSDYVYLLNTNSISGERSLSDHICTLWNKDIERRDMYVHEWQNLYFALTGNELTIKE